MKVNSKGRAIAAFAVAATLGLAGCAGGQNSSGESPDESGGEAASKLTVWVDADRAAVLKEPAADFEEETGVKVDLVQKDFGEIRDQFVSQVPTGKGPDVAVGAHDWLGTLVTNGVVAPVELGDKAEEFEKVATDAWTYDGKVYGVPYSIENIALIRNTALAPEAPATFDEMVEMANAAGTEYKVIVGLDPAAGDPYHMYPFQTSFGAPVFGTNADGTYNADDLQIGNEGGVQFAQWLQQQGAAGVFNPNLDGDLAREAFNAGKGAFYITGPWNVPAAQDAGIEVAVDPIPAPGPNPAQPFVGVQGFFLSAKSENVVAATNFLTNYVGSEEVQTALYEIGGRAPALTSAFEAAVADDPIVAGFGKVGAEAVPMPNIPEMGAVWEFWGVTENAIIKGEGDPAQLWQKMSEDIAAAVAG